MPVRPLIRSLLLGVALLPLAPAPAASPAPHRVLAIFAHPDDELTVAPALAAEARRGAEVRIIYATSGDAGPGFSGLPQGAELGRVRAAEAACASAALGLPAPAMLGFGDGRLPEYARADGPHGPELTKALTREIAAARPDTIITWGPDGGYGHADHRMVGAMVTQIVQALPSAGRPVLLYPGIPANAPALPPQLGTWGTTAPDLLTRTIGYEAPDLAAAGRAAQCHQTQFDAPTRSQIASVLHAIVWRGAVHFRPALGQ